MAKETTTPDRSTAAAFPRYLTGEVLADSVALRWSGLFARRWQNPSVVDRILVPATPEPHIACTLRGVADFKERDIGGAWIERKVQAGSVFVTRSRTPYEVSFQSPIGQALDSLSLHIAVEPFQAALEVRYPGKTERVEVVDYFGRDEILWPICLTCAELLAARVPGKSPRVIALTQLIAAHIVENYTRIGERVASGHGGLPIHQLRKVEDYVNEHLADEMSVEMLAELVALSPSHFAHVFKETTGMTPLQFVTRQRITRAQQLIRETSSSLIEVGMDVGYSSPSHFAHVFRQIVGVTPTAFRKSL
ncbi:MAG: AraC family transcriptional regulator [Kiritimatiellae bacterium]|nr:AraC family transcriptional regulator [Kiritimatiellia bacterium]MCO5062776.1 AraC family transcriptional regulator [Kiritimatiellia bacterium]MCO6401496.1 helix-turn-helix transcriptional regulator [Verrucomicrobiota bacterium]